MAVPKTDIFEERKKQWEQAGGTLEGIIQNLLLKDLEKARTDKRHPLRKCIVMLEKGDVDGFQKELLKSNSQLADGIRFLEMAEAARIALQQADSEADKLIDLASHSDLEGFAKLPPVDGLTLLSVMAKMDEKTIEKANAIMKAKQSKIAKNSRRDALQIEILGIVQKKPQITSAQLLAELQSLQNIRTIVEVTGEEISFASDDKGNLNAAPISGLKDRLSRAKKELRIIKT